MKATLFPGGPIRVLERNLLAYRRAWLLFVGGLLEPLLFLLSVGVGVGGLVGKVPGPAGHAIEYRDFVAPGLMATAAMNGAVMDTTFMFFIKLKYWGVYGGMLTTPLTPAAIARGEIAWSVLRGTIYAGFFLVVMTALGLVASPWALLAVPAAALLCWAFAAVGAAASGYMRTYYDFDLVNVALIPSFLFSGTFFPLDRYPGWLATVVRLTPLYQGVDLLRGLTWVLDLPAVALHVAYLGAMGAVGTGVAGRRLGALLTP